MKILISQPATRFYAWQCEVLLQNLLDIGFNLNDVEIVCSGDRNEDWHKLACKYAARFFFYQNTSNSNYPSISRPAVLAVHFRQFPELSKETILYVDVDILFLKQPLLALQSLLQDDIVYLSDTKWYTGYSYLKSKEKHVTKNIENYDTDKILQTLCDKVGMSLEVVKYFDDHSGGAQYLLKGIDAAFWEEVEKDCHTIYNYFHYSIPGSVNNTYFSGENEGFQSFALADMLGVLWNLWKRGKTTKIIDKMGFHWPNHQINGVDNCLFLHMAGVSSPNDGLFYKTMFHHRLPYFEDFSKYKTRTYSYLYIQMLQAMKDKTCLK